MQITTVESKLLQAIAAGATSVHGPDIHTLKRLILKGLATGKDASSGDEDVYDFVSLTPDGAALLAH